MMIKTIPKSQAMVRQGVVQDLHQETNQHRMERLALIWKLVDTKRKNAHI